MLPRIAKGNTRHASIFQRFDVEAMEQVIAKISKSDVIILTAGTKKTRMSRDDLLEQP